MDDSHPLNCKCGRHHVKLPKSTDCKNVKEIMEALTYENECPNKRKPWEPPKFKMKPYKPRHYKDTCVPMVPSMHTRLRYIRHCPDDPPRRDSCRPNIPLKFGSSSTSQESGIMRRRRKHKKKKKSVRYPDLMPSSIYMPTTSGVVKHTESNKSIISVPSPKISGEVISARRASVKPEDVKPPLPPKSGYDLFKPHSGIVLNRDKTFVPDVVHVPGPSKSSRKKRKSKQWCMGGHHKKNCNAKKCRRYAAMKRRQQAKREVLSAASRKSSKGRSNICDLEDFPKQEHAQIPPNLQRGTLQTHSLTVLPCSKEKKSGIHYGILTGTFNMYDSKFSGRSRGKQALAMSVMAYCLAFHYHPKQWTVKLIDNLIDAGDQWYLQCLDRVHDHSAIQGICEVLPFGKKQILVLNKKRMQVILGEPEIVGYTMSTDPTVYNLCRALKAFFKDNRAGIMLSRVLKVVIWKDRVCYYLFDAAGRDSRAYSNYANGSAAIINVKDLDAVAEVLLSRSVLENQKFVLAPVKVLKMIDEKEDDDLQSDPELTQAEKAMMGYRILNENCAIVNANMHLGDRCFEDSRYRQALPIAIVAMTYAKISPPNTWYTKTLDKILRLGNKLFVECTYPKVLIDMCIDNIPNEIIIGPYACEIIIYRERVKGQLFTKKECILNIKTGLEEFFSHEYNSGILDFNNYALAVWRQKDMYYMFDPYQRTSDGMRVLNGGKACCFMVLNPDAMGDVFTSNWDYLPATTQFHIHAFKVLKLKKKDPRMQIVCTLSEENLSTSKKLRRKVLRVKQDHGDGKEVFHDVLPAMEILEIKKEGASPEFDEEQMGDIISLVDSIQEDYIPPIPLRYKNWQDEPEEPKIVNLDSPTVSATQVLPPWPKPRDKSNEVPEPDPDPEPTPPPTPPPAPPPEGGEEEEAVEEEEDEEKKKENEEKRKAEEEARRKAEELPPPLPPPPPSPQPEPELAPEIFEEDEEEETAEAFNVDRRILLAEDAKFRAKLRQIRKKMTPPLEEGYQLEQTASKELQKPSNFKTLPDTTQIVRANSALGEKDLIDVLPFAAIMAIVTSYKYSINTWTTSIATFVVDTAKKLYDNKKAKFQLAPVHVIPKISIGQQAFHANIDVIGEGPTWQLEDVLQELLFNRYDRGMVTTATYSCAVFRRNGLYYLFDGSPCNPMGLRVPSKGKACFLRFRTLHDMVCRILYNKDGQTEDQQFVLSRILVRRLYPESRYKLPENYDYETGEPKDRKTKPTLVDKGKASAVSSRRSTVSSTEPKAEPHVGYVNWDGVYRIDGTTCLKDKGSSGDVKSCHFVCLIAMLMAAMHPIRIWDHIKVDTCIEKGLEIYKKATNKSVCEKRVIKNIILDGKFIDVNIKKIIVINENTEKTLDQYMKAVMRRLRYVIVRFGDCSVVVCNVDGYYHLFDPYAAPNEDQPESPKPREPTGKRNNSVACWTLYRSMDALIKRLRKSVSKADSPEFYTFELTSVKTAPRRSALNYRLSPLFKPDGNPNEPYLVRRKVRPTVDEKMYWLDIETVPWSRMNPNNDLGIPRDTPKSLWKAWDIEFPGDLFSVWGTLHPLDRRFPEDHRGKQYLATCVVALAMTEACSLSAWTGAFLDGVVEAGERYHEQCLAKIGNKPNYEVAIEDLDTKFDDMYPYSFTVKFESVIFGFVYNLLPDRFNLSKALSYFFEKDNKLGILTSPSKNLAFGRAGVSFFMFDCQSHGSPLFTPGQGAAYMLKCESLNRLIYCMTITLSIRRHAHQFHLYKVSLTLGEKTK